jgi:hypothetical protein
MIGAMAAALIEHYETFMPQYRINLADPDAARRVTHFI